MADDTLSAVDKIRASLAANKLANGKAPTPTMPSTPAPGFRFATGDPVIDLVAGARGVVIASYYASAGADRIYEVRTAPGSIIARLERELERDGPQNVPAFLPRI